MAARAAAAPVVLDTSVLLNFVKLDRLELLGRVGMPVTVPDQVLGEVLVPAQRQAVAAAVTRHLLRPLRGMARRNWHGSRGSGGTTGSAPANAPCWPWPRTAAGPRHCRTGKRRRRAGAGGRRSGTARPKTCCWR